MIERKQSCCPLRVPGWGWCWLFIGLNSWTVNGRLLVSFFLLFSSVLRWSYDCFQVVFEWMYNFIKFFLLYFDDIQFCLYYPSPVFISIPFNLTNGTNILLLYFYSRFLTSFLDLLSLLLSIASSKLHCYNFDIFILQHFIYNLA